VIEAAEAGIALVVVLAEEVPAIDRQRIRAHLSGSGTRLIGPGCPGIVTPGGAQLGLPPSYVYARGSIGILSHSVVLAHEAAWQTTAVGLGQSTVASLGRRQIAAEAFGDCLSLLLADPATAAAIVVVDSRERVEGHLASVLRRRSCGKPVVAHVMTPAAPRPAEGVLSFERAAAAHQAATLKDAGAILAETPLRIGQILSAAIQTPARPQPAGPRDFATAIRRVEREIYGPVLRLVGEEPQIST
jgi:succinyl-CoA synthetase alpha subunit